MVKSLSIRLLFIFIASLIVLIGLLYAGIEYSISNKVHNLQASSLAIMSRIIIDRDTHQISVDRAMHLAERTGLRIHIRTSEQSWSSVDQNFDETKFQFTPLELKPFPNRKNHHKQPPQIELAKRLNFNIYRIQTKRGVVFFEVDKPHIQFEWYWLLIAGLFILCLYLSIRYLFAPVADIRHVVKEVRQGNFLARTNTHRQDELGELAKQVDNMAEDLDRLIESKRSLLLSISHELRTPLTRAKISSQLLDTNKHRESLQDDLGEMENIISELIEAEKLSQATPLARQVVDINELIKEVLAESFTDNGIEFMPLTETSFVNIDPTRIKLLVKNLLKNAVQYSMQEHIEPRITIALSANKLIIKVIDKGVGMPAELVDRLTEPFYRLDQSRQRETGGFGLGLYLCQAIVKAHHGELLIDSKEGDGTSVTATINLSE